MNITVVGRDAKTSSRLRDYVGDKVVEVEQFDPRVQRVEVEVTHERNPCRAGTVERVEITVVSKGPIIRVEAFSSDRFAAFDIVMGKLIGRPRQARDRKRNHHRCRTVVASNEDLQAAPGMEVPLVPDTGNASIEDSPSISIESGVAVEAQLSDPPVIVRQKLYEAKPMTVDKVLCQMELVEHPFYLFIEKSSEQPCAVYHRYGWTCDVTYLDARMLQPHPTLRRGLGP